MESAAKASGHPWWHWALPIFLTVLILALAGWAATRREKPAMAAIDLENGAKLELVATLTQSNPKADLSTRARKMYDRLPLPMRDIIARFVRPSPAQVVSGSNLKERDTTLVFVVKSREVAALSSSDLSRAIDRAEFNWVRFNYGSGYYSEVVRLEQDYTMGSGEKIVRIATIPDVPAISDRLTLEFVKVGDVWSYGFAHKSAELVTSVEIDNPLHRQVQPLENPVELPAAVAHGNTTVTLWRVVSKVVREPMHGLLPGGDALLNSPTAFKASEGTGADPHASLAVLDLEEHGTTTPEWEIANVKTFYGKSNIPFVTNGTPHRFHSRPYIQVFGNDVGLLKQPVKLAVELIHKRNFGPDELQTVELPLPPKGGKSVPASNAKLHFWNNEVEVIGAFHDLRANVGHSEVGSDQGLSVLVKHTTEHPRIMTAKLFRPDGRQFDISDYGNSSGTSSGSSGRYFYRTFDIEKAFQKSGRGSLADYTTVSVDIVSPKFHPRTFEFIAEPSETGWTEDSKQ